MLLTIEKVIILKSVSIFAETPEPILAEMASILEEIEVKAGETVIRQGDIGTSMYIIIDGHVRVYTKDREIAQLGEREVFGEMAALDPEPRSATVAALEDTRLFRLEQEALYDLMAEHIEVARGIIRVLCRRIRKMVSS